MQVNHKLAVLLFVSKRKDIKMNRLNYLLPFLLLFFVSCKKTDRESGFVEINDTKIYYEIAGTGDPLVLIHGWSFDTRCWDNQFDVFADKYRVLRYDLRGFGRSALPDTGKSYSHTADLEALLDTLNIQKTHILGHSFGGKIAFDFVFNNPERTISLILPDAAMDVQGLKITEDVKSWIRDTWKAGREKGIEEAKKIWINGSPLKPAMNNPLSAPVVKQMIEDYSGWHWANNDPCNYPAPFSPKRLNEIKVSTLIIVGELNPKIYHEWADIQNKNILNSQKEIIPHAGHALNIENPEKFNELVLRFLSKI